MIEIKIPNFPILPCFHILLASRPFQSVKRQLRSQSLFSSRTLEREREMGRSSVRLE